MDWNNIIKEVVVVEGYHDLALLKEVRSNIDVIVTNGSEISKQTLEELKLLNKTRGIIVFTDPDMQGERIRRQIEDVVGNVKHAFIAKQDAISKNKKKVGIEHASKDVVIKALKNVYTPSNRDKSPITMRTLYHYNLVGTVNAKQRRKFLGEKLGIGMNNAKTMLRKLQMFQIKTDQIKQIMEELK